MEGFYQLILLGVQQLVVPDAVLGCTCGKVKIKCVNSQGLPAGGVARLECGCCDCRARLCYAESLGGPKAFALPEGSYWPNDLEVLQVRRHCWPIIPAQFFFNCAAGHLPLCCRARSTCRPSSLLRSQPP